MCQLLLTDMVYTIVHRCSKHIMSPPPLQEDEERGGPAVTSEKGAEPWADEEHAAAVGGLRAAAILRRPQQGPQAVPPLRPTSPGGLHRLQGAQAQLQQRSRSGNCLFFNSNSYLKLHLFYSHSFPFISSPNNNIYLRGKTSTNRQSSHFHLNAH